MQKNARMKHAVFYLLQYLPPDITYEYSKVYAGRKQVQSQGDRHDMQISEWSLHVQDNLKEQVKTIGQALDAKEEHLRTVTGEVAALRKDLERAKKSAKFDLVAREGQTKKLGILEHTATTLRHELNTNVERRHDCCRLSAKQQRIG